MIISFACTNIVKRFESCRLKAFKPTPDDVWTIGWGRTVGVHQGMTCTQAQANQWLIEDMMDASNDVNAHIDQLNTLQREFDAMVSLAYNIGKAGFNSSTVLRDEIISYHNAGFKLKTADAFLLWDKQKGAVLKGLDARRHAERALYLGVPE